MTRTQRLTFLGLAVAILIAAVVLIGSSGHDSDSERAASSVSTATATPEPTETAQEPGSDATATPEPTPDLGPILTAGEVTRIEVNKGDRVRFRARSAEAEEVHVHGYDISKDVPPGQTIRMSFIADIEGIFEIEFEHSAEPIGELRVEPN